MISVCIERLPSSTFVTETISKVTSVSNTPRTNVMEIMDTLIHTERLKVYCKFLKHRDRAA